MADKGNPASLTLSESQDVESKMRQALGLNSRGPSHGPQQRPEQARQRHRFVQDGGVPVTVLNPRQDTETAGLKERIAELQSALQQERAAHGMTRRNFQEQQALAQALQTRLAHADLAHNEALAQERDARIAAQEALAAEASGTAKIAEADVSNAAVTSLAASAAKLRVDAQKSKRGRPRTALELEPKPVRWWTPSYRAKTKA